MMPLSQLLDQQRLLYEALADLRTEVLPRDPRLFALMAEGTFTQLRELQQQIDQLCGVLEVRELDSDIWLKAEGVAVSWPDTRSSVLTALLDSLRKGVQNAAQYLHGFGFGGGRPLEALKQACDLEVVGLQPGSLVVELRLPYHSQPAEMVDFAKVRQALDDYLGTAAWAGSDEDSASLEHQFPDEFYRELLLAEVKRLTPRQNGSIQSIHLSGSKESQQRYPVQLTRASGRRIHRALERRTSEAPQTHEGTIREVDLDALTFTLRKVNQVEEIRCIYPDQLQETVKAALDEFVRVSGVPRQDRSRTYSSLVVADLELLGEMNETTEDRIR